MLYEKVYLTIRAMNLVGRKVNARGAKLLQYLEQRFNRRTREIATHQEAFIECTVSEFRDIILGCSTKAYRMAREGKSEEEMLAHMIADIEYNLNHSPRVGTNGKDTS